MHFSFSRFPFAQKSQKTLNANQIIFWVPSVFESVVKLEFCFSLPLPTLLEIPLPVFTAHFPYLPRPLFFQGFRPIFPPQCWSVPLENGVLNSIDKELVDQICSFKTAGYQPSSFCLLIKLGCVSVQSSPKRQTWGLLLTSHLVNNQYLLTSFFFQTRDRNKNVKRKHEQVIRKN